MKGMSRFTASAVCALMGIAVAAACISHSQTGKTRKAPPPPAQPQSDNTPSNNEPNLTPLQTVQYLNKKVDLIRIPDGMDTGDATIWPGYFAIEQTKGTIWWVRGARTSMSGWEIRYSSAEVDHFDLNFLTLGKGYGDYETITIKCKSSPDSVSGNPCWHNWVASWDDQSPALSGGHFASLHVAREVDKDSQEILDGRDYSISPLRKQILLFDDRDRHLIDVEPTKPFSELQIYLGSADSDTSQRMFRALKYLLKTMPPVAPEKDPFGP